MVMDGMLDRGISDYDFNSNEVGKLAIYEQVFWRVGTDNPFYFDQFWNVRDFVGNRVQLSGYFQCNMELYDNLADLYGSVSDVSPKENCNNNC